MTPIEDDGAAVHYTAVKRGTPVISSDGQEVGTVVKVLDNYREHIFDGLVIRRPTAPSGSSTRPRSDAPRSAPSHSPSARLRSPSSVRPRTGRPWAAPSSGCSAGFAAAERARSSARRSRPRAGRASAPRCARDGASASSARRPRSAGEPRARRPRRPAPRLGRAQATGDPVLDQRARPALGHGHDRQAARLGLEQHLAEGVRAAREEEEVGARVGARQLLALEPAEERGVRRRAARAAPPPRARRPRAPGAGAGRARARARKASASRSAPFSVRQPARVEHVDLAGQRGRRRAAPGRSGATSTPRSQRPIRSAAIPSARSDSSADALGERTSVALAVEGGERQVHARPQPRVAGAQPGVGAELRVVAAHQRQLHDPGDERGRDPGRAGGAKVHEVVAALGERLDERRQARHAHLQPRVEGDVDLARRRAGGGRRSGRCRSPRPRSRARRARGSRRACA